MSKQATPAWQTHPIFTRPDHSFVITHNGYPYHAPHPSTPDCEEFAELWAEVDAFAKANPAKVQPEPAPPAPTADELMAMCVFEIKAELAALDTISARPLRAIAAGTATEDDRTTLAELEASAEALRIELTRLAGPTDILAS